MEVASIINLSALVSKHSGCQIGDVDSGYTYEQFTELVDSIFSKINQFSKWDEESIGDETDECEDQVLEFHKGY